MNVIQSVKNHPYLFGGVAIGAIIVIWIATKSSNAGAVEMPAAPMGSVETGSALQIASMQAASQANALQAQLQDSQIKADATIALADIQGKYSYDIASLAADARKTEAWNAAELAKMQSTLAANIQGQQIAANREIQLGNFETQQYMAALNADVQKNVAATLADATYRTAKLASDERMTAGWQALEGYKYGIDAKTASDKAAYDAAATASAARYAAIARQEVIVTGMERQIAINNQVSGGAWGKQFAAQGYTQPGFDYAGAKNTLAQLTNSNATTYIAASGSRPMGM